MDLFVFKRSSSIGEHRMYESIEISINLNPLERKSNIIELRITPYIHLKKTVKQLAQAFYSSIHLRH